MIFFVVRCDEHRCVEQRQMSHFDLRFFSNFRSSIFVPCFGLPCFHGFSDLASRARQMFEMAASFLTGRDPHRSRLGALTGRDPHCSRLGAVSKSNHVVIDSIFCSAFLYGFKLALS